MVVGVKGKSLYGEHLGSLKGKWKEKEKEKMKGKSLKREHYYKLLRRKSSEQCDPCFM